jgi:hypothetical protein
VARGSGGDALDAHLVLTSDNGVLI